MLAWGHGLNKTSFSSGHASMGFVPHGANVCVVSPSAATGLGVLAARAHQWRCYRYGTDDRRRALPQRHRLARFIYFTALVLARRSILGIVHRYGSEGSSRKRSRHSESEESP